MDNIKENNHTDNNKSNNQSEIIIKTRKNKRNNIKLNNAIKKDILETKRNFAQNDNNLLWKKENKIVRLRKKFIKRKTKKEPFYLILMNLVVY